MAGGAATMILQNLNEPQRQAVMHRDGPLLVLAGPGSGKTRVITRRTAYLVHTGVAPHNILAITFTNKAAGEMKQRIEALGVARGMWVYTFHALCVRLLREFGTLGGVQPGFSIYDQTDQKRVIKDALALCDIPEQLLRPERALAKISHAKNRLQTPAEFAERASFHDQRMLARVYDAYDQLLRQRNAVDFDDLLMRVAQVLRDHPDIAERLNIRFQYVLIDEYQDTNHAQYLIARSLSRHHGNICATGDPDQSIYGWRGANIRNILEFEHDFPDARIVRLEENYRSTKHICRAASKLIACNTRRKAKDVWTNNEEGEPVTVWEFAEGRDEARRIAETIAQLHVGGGSYNSFAIAYRINAITRGLEEALRAEGIPYRIARGVEFYNRKEIKDTLAYLRVIVNPADQVALLRIINTPARGIGATTVQRLIDHAEREGQTLLQTVTKVDQVPTIKSAAAKKVSRFAALLNEISACCEGRVAQAVGEVLRRSGLEVALEKESEEQGEDRLANVRELVSAATQYDDDFDDGSLEDFLQRVSLTSDQDSVDEKVDAVLLLTLHAAKGLEFPVVFIVGLEQGLLPHDQALMRDDGDVEEERRLCFVGITRARQRLYLSHARQRFIRGSLVPRATSQFIRELPDDAILTESFARPRWGRGANQRDGFVRLDDQLAPEEIGEPGRIRRRSFTEAPGDPADRMIDVSADRGDHEPSTPYADWRPGTFVEHEEYGIGCVRRISSVGGLTSASIVFAGAGTKDLILEHASLKKV